MKKEVQKPKTSGGWLVEMLALMLFGDECSPSQPSASSSGSSKESGKG